MEYTLKHLLINRIKKQEGEKVYYQYIFEGFFPIKVYATCSAHAILQLCDVYNRSSGTTYIERFTHSFQYTHKRILSEFIDTFFYVNYSFDKNEVKLYECELRNVLTLPNSFLNDGIVKIIVSYTTSMDAHIVQESDIERLYEFQRDDIQKRLLTSSIPRPLGLNLEGLYVVVNKYGSKIPILPQHFRYM